jgi:hypothetical protein
LLLNIPPPALGSIAQPESATTMKMAAEFCFFTWLHPLKKPDVGPWAAKSQIRWSEV